MVEVKKEERKVVVNRGNYIFTFEQEQHYDKKTVDNMIESWNNKKKELQMFLDNFDKTIEDGIKAMKAQMEQQKEKVMEDMENVDAGITLWGNPKDVTCSCVPPKACSYCPPKEEVKAEVKKEVKKEV